MGTEPETIIVAPKSPSARPKAMATPATMPRRASGNVTRNAMRHRDSPMARAACSKRGSTTAIAARENRRQYGNDSTICATTIPVKVKVRGWPKRRTSRLRIGPGSPHAREEVVTHDGGRERHGQAEDGLDRAASREVALREDVPEGDAA